MKGKSSGIKKFMTTGLFFVICLLQMATLKGSTPGWSGSEKEIEIFVDDFFKQNMEKEHIPGAAIAIVKEDKICFMKGYGYADIENKIPVDPKKTLFGMASVSKLLTATAVMQQYEEGNLELDTDVNSYLRDFKVEESGEAPVTIGSLLTHTSGFIQSNIGIGTRNPLEIKSLGDYLKTSMPQKEYDTGQFFSYSNQGMSLAGHIVELVSGKCFQDYVDEKIFKTLDMKRSTFRQPLTESMEKDKALGYSYWSQEESYYRVAPIYYQVAPAGGCYTTVSDMAHFIMAHLNEGLYEGNRLLEKETMEEMHNEQFTHHPQMPGQAYGFWESYDHNQRALFHTGTSEGYASLLYILPEQHMGFILCYNRATNPLREDFKESFLDRFFPEGKAPEDLPLKRDKEEMKQFEGLYWNVEKPRHTLDKLEVLMSDGLVRVTLQEDGSLKLTGYYGEDMGGYIEAQPGVFKKRNSNERIVFEQKGIKGCQHELYIKNNAFLKVKWYQHPTLYLGLGVFSLSVIFISPIVFMRMLVRKKAEYKETAVLGRFMAYLGCFVAVLIIAFCAVAAMVTFRLGKYAFMFGIPLSIKIILIIPIILCVAAVVLILGNSILWKESYWTLSFRCFFTLYTMCVVTFIVFLRFWNMIGVL